MNRKNFANTSGVIIDTCRAHGVWFDRDELGRIVQFVMRGGLETARRQELERLEQRLRDQRNRESGEPSLGPYSPSEPTFVDELIHAWMAAISDFPLNAGDESTARTRRAVAGSTLCVAARATTAARVSRGRSPPGGSISRSFSENRPSAKRTPVGDMKACSLLDVRRPRTTGGGAHEERE